MDTPITKQELLEALYAPYKKCMECPLGGLGRTQVVFGDGDPNAALMIIGEAPGRDEDIQGKPFVGRSGKLLTRILEEALGLSRKEVFITNIVKCRPPDNRKPLPLEITTCKNLLLLKQIKIVQPKVICTLGASAIEGLIDQPVKITKIRGNPIIFESIPIIPTYHPAYILRNLKEMTYLIQDLQKAYSYITLDTH